MKESLGKSGFVDRVVASTPEGEKEVLNLLDKIAKNQETDDRERDKTAEEIKLIETINSKLGKFLSRYELKRNKVVPPANIHIVDMNRLSEEKRKILAQDSKVAIYSHRDQAIAIFTELSRHRFIQVLVHEMLHANSFESYTLSGEEICERRLGLNVFTKDDPSNPNFHYLDEAVISELTERFIKKYFQEFKTDEFDDFSYEREREELWKIIEYIFKRSARNKEFQSKEDIFCLFAKSVLTGRLLPLVRIIEKTFGKGSFRKLGKATTVR